MSGIIFDEAMRGDLIDGSGAVHAVDFEVSVQAATIGHFARTGRARLVGVVHALPWADHAAIDGELTMSASRRTLCYEVFFAGTDERRYHLSGRKDVRLLDPFRSMTLMPVTLTCGGVELAAGEMRFDLNEIVALLASFRPAQVARHTDPVLPAHGVPTPDPLSAAETGTLRALSEAIFVPGERVPAAGPETMTRALAQIANFPADVRTAWRAGLAAVGVVARLLTGRAIRKLRPDKLLALLQSLTAPGDGRPLRRLVDFVLMPLRSAHFGRDDYMNAIGFPDMIQRVREPDPRWMRQVTTAEDLEESTTLEAEVVVVGTGAGGAAMATALAERGVAVALVEEGHYNRRPEFSGSPERRMHALYRERGLTFTVGSPPISIPLGRTVGGTTAINSGTCLRAPDDVLDAWRHDLGAPDDFIGANFSRYYDQVSRELNVGPNERRYLGKIADVVATGAEAMGLEHRPLPRNAPGCDGQGACIFGCPTAAKRSTDVSYVPRALRAGASLFTGLPVRKVLMRGRRAVGVEARGTDRFGAPKTLRIRAEAVVLSCGTLLTPLMLRDAGIDLPWLGRNLSVHPGMGMLAMCADKTLPWSAVPQGYGVHGAGDGIVFEGAYMPPPFLVSTVPLMGAELTRWMDAHDHVAQFGFMIRDSGDGRVMRGPTGRRLVSYNLSDRSHARLQRGSALLAEMMIRGGATEVLTGFGHTPIVRTIGEARALGTAPLGKSDFNLLGAHPLGTCRMAADPGRGVVDPEHRVFGTANLYVADGSTVPSSLGVNPQMTIMAMALRAGEALASRLESRALAA